MSSTYRGHRALWLYADTGQPVRANINRPCGHCGLANTPEGHDGCVGTIPGAMNACCGHGAQEHAYVQVSCGATLTGIAALRAMALASEAKR